MPPWVNDSFFTLLATVAIAIFTWRLYVATNRLWLAGERQLLQLKKSSEQQLRAYVSVEGGGVSDQDTATGTPYQVEIIMVNRGQTPAYDVEYRSNCAVRGWPPAENMNLELPEILPHRSRNVLGPSGSTVIYAFADRFVTEIEVAQIRAGRPLRLYFWGIVTYRDAFGQARETKFCRSLVWSSGKISSLPTREHNGAT